MSPSPRNSSFIYPNSKESPYRDWLELAKTEREISWLLEIFRGVPQVWIEWVEKQAEAQVKRGVMIEKALEYRMATLWNGIILLQEGKFICDSVENALRQSFLTHIAINHITYSDLLPSVPNNRDIARTYEARCGDIAPTALVDLDFILITSFYEITETIARNWKYISKCTSSKLGFNKVFQGTYCRDCNNFRRDMRKIRTFRNTIAHSKELLSPQEVQSLYELANRWLVSLGVELNSRIITYRDRRPKFLEPLVMN